VVDLDGEGEDEGLSRDVLDQWMLSSEIGSVAALSRKHCLLAWGYCPNVMQRISVPGFNNALKFSSKIFFVPTCNKCNKFNN
jgi:hypothetical protein